MVKVHKEGVWILNGREIVEDRPENAGRLKQIPLNDSDDIREAGRKNTIAAGILLSHNEGKSKGLPKELKLRFDSMASHDITYVNIIQSAKASGFQEFPLPYVLTNCHNSLCAVGGTINADDHRFGLSAAKRYGGIYVPPHLAVIHSYVREEQSGGGRMILGSDSHTRYGALGTMGVGEGGGELVKQLLRQTYDVPWPRVIAVYLSGKVKNGVGPQDVALAIIAAVFKDGFVKNAALEFIGDGIAGLSADFRSGIDVMTTETTCWSSVWETDELIRQYYITHRREDAFKRLFPGEAAYYDGMVYVDLSAVKPMIALPFHPSNACELDTLLSNPGDIFRQAEKEASIGSPESAAVALKLCDKIDSLGRIRIDQAIVAGCAGGTYSNIMAVASILEGRKKGAEENKGFSFSVYPGSQPILLELSKNGALSSLISHGVVVRSAFCGPCFGAGDVPSNNGLSIRHTTRNFPNREGSKPDQGQISSVCLMDARSIAATALNGGYLASAESLDWEEPVSPYSYNDAPYVNRVYNGVGKPDSKTELCYGPNIADWPPMERLGEHILLKIISFITDPVTTTDELIPSGETSSYRSNPVKLAEFTLSRKDPAYVGKAKAVKEASLPEAPDILDAIQKLQVFQGKDALKDIQLGSAIFARKPGDGSAREQAASCQRVLGGAANFANEYATKRYRSNLINWGILPFITPGEVPFKNGDYVFIPGIAEALRKEAASVTSYVVSSGQAPVPFTLALPELNESEKELILAGSLLNYYRNLHK